MKKLMILLIAVILLSGCGQSVVSLDTFEEKTKSNETEDLIKNESEPLDEDSNGKTDDLISSDIYLGEAPDSEENVLKSVFIESKKAENGDIIVFATNNNNYVIPDLELQVVFYKGEDIIDTDTDGHDVLVPQNTVVSKISAPDSYDNYEIKATAGWKYATSYRNWIYNIKVKSNIGNDNIIIQFENAGNIDIEELEYIVVFYNGDDVLKASYPSDVTDFKAGSAIIEEVSTYGIEFDGYEIYINQAHTFLNSNGEAISEKLPENIGSHYRYYLENGNGDNEEETKETFSEPEKQNKSEDIEEQTTTESESQSTEPEITVTTGMKNALKSAKQYIDIMAFSYEGLIDQLEYDKYSHEEAIYAADNCGADWDKQALKSAKNYLSIMAFSYDGLIGQLEYDKFTSDQSKYAADNCGADWNEQAAKSAKNYINIMSFSRDGLIEQLEFDGFTHEQAVYGAEQNGY